MAFLRSSLRVVLALIATLAAGQAHSQGIWYTVEPIPGSGAPSYEWTVYDVADTGLVVGIEANQFPAVWSREAGRVRLPVPGNVSFSTAGGIWVSAGETVAATFQRNEGWNQIRQWAVLWRRSRQDPGEWVPHITDFSVIGSLRIHAVADDGSMAGTVNVDGVVSLFRWMPDSPDSTTGQSVVIPLPDPSWGVNAASETGYFVGTASGSRSWRYRPGRGFEILPGLGLIDEAYAAGINSEGIACGSSRDVWGRTRAVVWLPQGRPVDLGLPEWIQISAATHVNDSQHIAGYFWGGGGQRPFVWDSFLGARPIEALVDTGRPYDIRQPTKITRSGLILAYAWSHSQPFEGWIILRPVPPPTTPVVVDEGKFTTSLNTLRANWESTEEYNGIAEYQYAISTSPSDPGSGYVVPWTSAGTQTGVTRTDLSLVPGTTYYWHVRAKSGNGKWSAVGSSDGITVLSEGEIVRSPGQAKLRPDGEWVMFEGVVTASFSASGLTYVQAPDRSSGIAVSAAETFPPGSVVQVAGSLATNADGERFVRDAVLTGKGSTAPLVPVCLTLRGCSGRAFFHSPTTGAGQRGVTEPPGRGLSTTGLLVRVTGRVNEIGPEFVLLNDGSFPFLTGVRVERASLPPGIQVGDAVSVTAISSLRRAGTAYQLLLRPRSSADWEKVQ